MSAAQLAARANFKKAIAYRKKTGCTLKEAFAAVKGGKVGIVKKKVVANKKVGATMFIEKGESKTKRPTKVVQVKRSNKGTFEKFKTVGSMQNYVRLTRINNDVNGNPRYVAHFLDFINQEENTFIPFNKMYEYAIKKAKQIGGKKYHNKQYGGGIVFQSYNTDETIKKIIELKNTTPKIKI